MKLVYICSPLRGDADRNIRKANGYCLFAAKQSLVPVAPHVMFPGILDDAIPEERSLGLSMGLELVKRCDEVWVFGERLSEGMQAEIRAAEDMSIPIHYFNEKCERRPAYSHT